VQDFDTIKQDMLASCNRVRRFFGAAPLDELPRGRTRDVFNCSGRKALSDATAIDIRINFDHAYVNSQFAAMMAQAFGTRIVSCNCHGRESQYSRCNGDSHIELPQEWQDFINAYDCKEYPELIARGHHRSTVGV
jgi:hypothetical protein